MPKLTFRVNADTSPVKKFRTELEQIEKTMIRIKGENFSFDHWIKEFDRLKTELEKKRVRIAELKKEILSVDSFTNPKAIPPLEKEYAKAKKDQEALINETMDLSNKFGKAYDDLVETLGKAQKVTDSVTVKLIEQKNVVANLQSEVRLLNAEYRNADKDKKPDILSQKTSKQKELEQERVTLNALRAEQERAKLSVKGLADETRNYEKVVGKVSGAQAEAALVSSRFEKSLLRIGGIATLQRFASDVVKIRGEFQQLDVAFTTLLQSKEKANALMGQMVETAAKTPFNLTELATGAKQLVAYGFASEGVNDTLIRLGNIAAGLGLPLERLTYLYGTTMTQGRLYARDLMQFTTSGIPMLQGLADMYGVSTDKVNEMVTAGKIGFPEVQKVIENMTNEGGKFYNLMEEQSKTITGKISNLGDAWDEMLNKIGQSQEGLINGSIDMAKYLVENYEEIGRILIGIIGTYGVYKTALITNITLTHSWAVATRVDTVAKGIQTIATKAQTIAQIALNSAMKANPAVLVASLVAGVAAAMWVLHDSTSAAEKAQRKYNNEQEKFTNKENERKQKIEELIRVIQDETETQYSKIKAYEELQRYSPALVSAYNMEQLATLELAKSQKALNEERDNVNYDNIIANIKKYTEYINRLSKPGDKMKNVGNLYSGMVSEYGVNTTFKERFEQAAEDLKKWDNHLNEYNRLKKQAEENAKPVEVKLLEAKNNRDQILQEFLSAKLTLEEEQRKIQESGFGVIPIDVQIRFDNAKAQLASIDKTIASLMQGNTTQTYKEAYSTAQREWKAAQKALEESKKKSKADYDKAKKDLDEKEKAYKDLGGITGSSLTKQESAAEKLRKQQESLRQQQEKYKLLMDKQSLDQARSAEDLQTQVDQARINAMDEGSKKTIAQMELNFEKEMQAIDRQKEDLLRKKIEDERAKFESDPKNKNNTFNPTGIVLSDGEKKQFDNLYKAQIESFEKDTKSLLDKLLEKYRDYDAQRIAIEKDGNAEIAYLQTQRTDDNAKEIDRAIEVAKEKIKEGVQSVNDAQADAATKDNGFLKNLFGDTSQMAFKDLQNLIDQAKQLQSYLSGTGDSTGITFISPEQLKTIEKSPAELDKLKKALDKLLKGEKGNEWDDIFDGFTKGLAKLKSAKGFKEVSQGMQDIGESASKASSIIGGVAGNLASMFEEMGNTGAADAMSGVQDAMNAISNIGQGFAKGGIVGGIAAAVGEAANFIGKAFAASARHQAALKEIMNETIAQQRAYNLLLLEQNLLYEKGTTIFGTDAYGKATNAIKVMKQATADLNEELSGTAEQKKSQARTSFMQMIFGGVKDANAALKQAYAGLADIEIKTGHKKTGLFGWGKGKDIYSSILSVYPELIDANGKFNASLAETIINTKEMSDEDKAAFQNMIDHSKQAEEALKAVSDYLTDIFGDLGNSMSDALADAFRNGTDAAQSFTDSVSKMLETLAKQMVYSVTLAPIIEKAQSQMMDVMKNTGLSDEEKFKQWTGILDNLVGEAVDQQDYANRLLGEFQQMAKDKGFDIFDSDSSDQEASKRDLASMSQDTGNELNGRFTAFQISNEEIKNQSILQSQSMNLLTFKADALLAANTEVKNIADETRTILANSYLELVQISENTGAIIKPIQQMQKDMAEVKNNTSKL